MERKWRGPPVGKINSVEHGGMFLRKNRKKSNGEVYEYWTLCETVRTELGPRQRVVATLRKLSEEELAARWGTLKRCGKDATLRPIFTKAMPASTTRKAAWLILQAWGGIE